LNRHNGKDINTAIMFFVFTLVKSSLVSLHAHGISLTALFLEPLEAFLSRPECGSREDFRESGTVPFFSDAFVPHRDRRYQNNTGIRYILPAQHPGSDRVNPRK
jgi:hypothetical protein